MRLRSRDWRSRDARAQFALGHLLQLAILIALDVIASRHQLPPKPHQPSNTSGFLFIKYTNYASNQRTKIDKIIVLFLA